MCCEALAVYVKWRTIHDILSTSDTTWNFAPSFGGDYSSSTVNNEWPLVREPDCDIGYIGELMEDGNGNIDTDLELRSFDFSLLPPLQQP